MSSNPDDVIAAIDAVLRDYAAGAPAATGETIPAYLLTDYHRRSIGHHELYWGTQYEPPPTHDIHPASDVPDTDDAKAIIRWVDQHAESGRALEPWQRDYVRRMLHTMIPEGQ